MKRYKVKLRYAVTYEVDAVVSADSVRQAMDSAMEELNRNLLPPFQAVKETKPNIASVNEIK